MVFPNKIKSVFSLPSYLKKQLMLIFNPADFFRYHQPGSWRKLLLGFVLVNVLLFAVFFLYNNLLNKQVNYDINNILADLLDNFIYTSVLVLLALVIICLHLVIFKFRKKRFAWQKIFKSYAFVFILTFFYTRIFSLFFLLLQQKTFLAFSNWLYIDIVLQYAVSGLTALYFLELLNANVLGKAGKGKKAADKQDSIGNQAILLILNLLINFLIFGP